MNFKKEGMGRALYDGEHSNEILVTNWSNGMKNGNGFIYDQITKKVTRRMIFVDNEIHEETLIQTITPINGIVECVDGSHWEGEIIDGEPCGEGCIFDEYDKLVYKGTYIDGAREGYGVSYYGDIPNQCLSYEGLWCRDVHHGEGIVYNRHGEPEVNGLFLEDILVSLEINIKQFSNIDKLSTLTERIIVADNVLNEIVSMDLYECRRLREIRIGDNSCKNVQFFSVRLLRDLESITIGVNSFTNLSAPTIPRLIDQIVATEKRICQIINCPRLKSICIGHGSFYEFQNVQFENLIALRELLLSPESINHEGAAGNNFFACESFQIARFPQLRKMVIGNFCFRYATHIVIEEMDMLESIVIGDDTFMFSTIVTLIDLPILKEWKVYGKSLNCCTQFVGEDIPMLKTINIYPLKIGNTALDNLKIFRIKNVSNEFEQFLMALTEKSQKKYSIVC